MHGPFEPPNHSTTQPLNRPTAETLNYWFSFGLLYPQGYTSGSHLDYYTLSALLLEDYYTLRALLLKDYYTLRALLLEDYYTRVGMLRVTPRGEVSYSYLVTPRGEVSYSCWYHHEERSLTHVWFEDSHLGHIGFPFQPHRIPIYMTPIIYHKYDLYDPKNLQKNANKYEQIRKDAKGYNNIPEIWFIWSNNVQKGAKK